MAILGDRQVNVPVEYVQNAERLGYDSVWTGEAYGADAMTPLAYIAGFTSRIRLGTSIIQLAARTPANAAMQAATIDGMSNGRFICGSFQGETRRSRMRYLVRVY